MPGDISNTDPALSANGNSDYVYEQVMETLVDLDPTTSAVIPELAQTWDVSSDGLDYTFHLAAGVTFHDGTPFNADAVKFNFDRWRNFSGDIQALASRYSRVYGGFGDASVIESVGAPDDSTVVIHLKEPRSNFLTTLSLTSFAISSPTALQKGDADNPDLKANQYANGSGPSLVGTGPFTFEKWVPGQSVTLAKYNDYWGTPAHLDGVVFRPFADTTAAFNALQAGDVDFLQLAAPTDLDAISSDPNLAIVNRGQSCNTFTININQKYPPFDNLDIRKAIAYALDREGYIKAFYAGQATVADNFAPEWMQYAIPMNIPTYDPDQARKLIQQSGIQSPTLDFWYPSDVTRPYMPDPKGEFEAMSRDLEAVGFKVVPHTEGWTTGYLSDRTAGKLPMWLFGNSCGWPSIDYMTTFAWFGTDNPDGVRTENGYGTPELQATLLAAVSATGEADAARLWKEAQNTIAADLPEIPILHALTPGAIRADVKGLVPSGLLIEEFQTIWLDR